jgi:hypothetical protein
LYPKAGKPVPYPFVASGSAPEDPPINLVFGVLIDQTTGQVFPGHTLPFPDPHRWAVLFKRDKRLHRSDPFTLVVFGVLLGSTGLPTVQWYVTLEIPRGVGGSRDEVDIGWPDSGEADLCPSNFVPFGGFNRPGTIKVTLSGGVAATASSVYYDLTDGFWSAQFDAFAQPATACNLDATLTPLAGSPDTAMTKSNLRFQNC